MPYNNKSALHRLGKLISSIGKPKLTEFKYKLLADIISGYALDALILTARRHESDWSDKTRFTVLEFLFGYTKEALPTGTDADRNEILLLAYQNLCASKIHGTKLLEQINKLTSLENKFFLAGLKSAHHDFKAGREKKLSAVFTMHYTIPDSEIL